MALLTHHLLKWQFQPARRSESWRITISEQRIWIPGLIRTSPSLKSYPAEIFVETYGEGRRQAVNETAMPAKLFPVDPPFTVTQVLDSRFLPGDPFEAWQVIRD